MAEKTLHDNSPSRDTRFVTRTLDELTRLSDRAVQHLLRRADYQDCILALQGASDEVRQKLLGNMSQRVRTFMEEELEASQADETAVQQAQRRLLDGLRQLRPSPGKQTAEYRARKRALKKRLKTHPVSRLDCEELTRLFGDLAAIAQQEGVLALEEYAQLMGDDPDDYLISLGLNRAVIGHDPTSNTRILEKRCRLLEEQLATRHRMILEGIALLQQRCLPAWMHEHLRAHYTLENESPQNLKGSSPPS